MSPIDPSRKPRIGSRTMYFDYEFGIGSYELRCTGSGLAMMDRCDVIHNSQFIIKNSWTSVLRRFAAAGHLDQPWLEPCDGSDQILLGRHDLVDVLVGHGNFIETG